MVVVALGCFLADVIFHVYGVPQTTNWEIFANTTHSLLMATICFESYRVYKKKLKRGRWVLAVLSWFYLFDMLNEFRWINASYEEYYQAMFVEKGSDTITIGMIVIVAAIIFIGMDLHKDKHNITI